MKIEGKEIGNGVQLHECFPTRFNGYAYVGDFLRVAEKETPEGVVIVFIKDKGGKGKGIRVFSGLLDEGGKK